MKVITGLKNLLPTLSGVFQSVLLPEKTLDLPNTMDATVVVGGEITGLSTAYYLALESESHKLSSSGKRRGVVLVERASGICAGASGQNEGVIGSFGMESPLLELAQLSAVLHAKIAVQYSGYQRYGYAGLNSYALFSEGYDPSNPRLIYPPKKEIPLDELPAWLRIPSTWQAGLVATHNDTQRLDAAAFCSFLQQQCEHLGVRFLFRSSAKSVAFNQETHTINQVTVRNADTGIDYMVPCDGLVIAAGSWSSQVFDMLFPQAATTIPISKTQPVQSWIRVRASKAPNFNILPVCNQTWLTPALLHDDLHISNYANGDFFVGGPIEEESFPIPLPGSTPASHDAADQIRKKVEQYLRLDCSETAVLVSYGRAHMPRLSRSNPIISEVSARLLCPQRLIDTADGTQQATKSGVYVSVGQNYDGLTLGPGSGKLMSDLILGKQPAIDAALFKFPE